MILNGMGGGYPLGGMIPTWFLVSLPDSRSMMGMPRISHPKGPAWRCPQILSRLRASSASGWAQRWAWTSDLGPRGVDLRLWLPGSLPKLEGRPSRSSVSSWSAKLKETQENFEARKTLSHSQNVEGHITFCMGCMGNSQRELGGPEAGRPV